MSLKNPAIWLVEDSLGHTSKARFFFKNVVCGGRPETKIAFV